ncbi:hypothetical protein BX600DRAFT_464388 [Xylariales sp. PMI_506]|nr:hypothetical protein BX600DRAFT_464388 [Xylariales sp. PMI_506]
MSIRKYLRSAYEEVHLTSESDLSAFQSLDGILKPGCDNLLSMAIHSIRHIVGILRSCCPA